MHTSEHGKGFIPILILVIVAAVVAVLFLSKDNLGNNSPSYVPPVPVGNKTSPVPTQPKGVVNLMLDPADASASVNQSLTVNVNIDTKTETATAVELHLSYDPNYLDAVLVKEGTFLPVVLSPAKIMAGSAVIVVGSNPTSPQKGTGTVAAVTFKAKKAGMTKVMIDKTTQVAVIGKTGDVLGSTSGTSVTIK